MNQAKGLKGVKYPVKPILTKGMVLTLSCTIYDDDFQVYFLRPDLSLGLHICLSNCILDILLECLRGISNCNSLKKEHLIITIFKPLYSIFCALGKCTTINALVQYKHWDHLWFLLPFILIENVLLNTY